MASMLQGTSFMLHLAEC